MTPDAIAETTLHAYVDGWLTSEQRAQVEVRLLQCAAEAARVRDYLAQRKTIRTYAGGGQDDVLPHYLIQSALGMPCHQRLWACGCVAAFVLGVALGWWAQHVNAARAIDAAPRVGIAAQTSCPVCRAQHP